MANFDWIHSPNIFFKNKRIQVCENHIFKFNYLNGWHIARYLAIAIVTVNHVDASIKNVRYATAINPVNQFKGTGSLEQLKLS